MSSQKELTPMERRKRTLVARNDRLRSECGEIWSAVGRRAEIVERGVSQLKWVPPVLSLLSTGALFLVRSRKFRGSECLEPALATISASMSRGRQVRKPAGEVLSVSTRPPGT